MDRHVIANMGAELGATTSVFPSDQLTREFMAQVSQPLQSSCRCDADLQACVHASQNGREGEWSALSADPGARYDEHDVIDLGTLQPLLARPSSPDNVVTVQQETAKNLKVGGAVRLACVVSVRPCKLEASPRHQHSAVLFADLPELRWVERQPGLPRLCHRGHDDARAQGQSEDDDSHSCRLEVSSFVLRATSLRLPTAFRWTSTRRRARCCRT